MTETKQTNWNLLSKDTELEAGCKYLCAPVPNPDDKDTIEATYFEKDDVMRVPLDKSLKFGKETAEERLLATIFGHTKVCAAPEDGLYIFSDKNLSQTGPDEPYQYCSKVPVLVKDAMNPCYITQLHASDDKDDLEETREKEKKNFGPTKQKRIEEAMASVNADPVAKECIHALIGDTQPWDGEADVTLNGGVYALDAANVWQAVHAVWGTVKAIALIPNEERDAAAAEIKQAEDTNGIREVINKFCKEHDVKTKVSYNLIGQYLLRIAEETMSFYEIRETLMHKEEAVWRSNICVLLSGYGGYRLPARIARTVKLKEMNAPTVILNNELRIAVIQFLATRYPETIIHVLPEFTDLFGVDPYGKRGEAGTCKASIGDEELFYAYKDPEDENENTEESKDLAEIVAESEQASESKDTPESENPDVEECECDDNCPEKRQCICHPYESAWAPNFMMRRGMGKYVLYNCDNNTYFRDENGEIKVFDECPCKVMNEINGKLQDTQTAK